MSISPILTLANVTWLLVAMLFVMAPHAARLPWWIVAVVLLAVGARWWIARRGWRLAPAWLMALIAIGVAAASYREYGRLFGREVGVALLIAMLSLKFLEMRTRRDAVFVLFLGFFLALTGFLYSQSIAMGLYMLMCVWIFVATLIGYNRLGSAPSFRERLVPAAWLVAQSIPMMLVLFFLFPRLAGPLWNLPVESGARSGLGDSLAPGDIAKLNLSDAVAFRVEFGGPVPGNDDLYWRGPVLGMQAGRGWRMYDASPLASTALLAEGPAIRYRVTMQATDKPWLFALELPVSIPDGAALLSDYQLRQRGPVVSLKTYEAASHLRYRVETSLSTADRNRYTRYDEAINPRLAAYGRQLRERHADPRTLLDELLAQYNRNFNYSLEPPLLGPHPMDEFFFDTRTGYCEHYAASFVLIMRAAGIPARIVTGYQGGEVNPITRQLVVRQSEAHAWAEIWQPDLGWLRVDPTFAVSPLRINRGLTAALGPVGVFDTIAAADKLGILRQVRYTWDAVNTRWNQWVVGFSQDRQRSLFENLGMEDIDWRRLALWLLAALALTSGGIGGLLLVRFWRTPREPIVAAYARFCERVARQGLARAPHEGPLAFLARIERHRPALASRARPVIDAYVAARYAAEGETAAVRRHFLRMARAFKAS